MYPRKNNSSFLLYLTFRENVSNCTISFNIVQTVNNKTFQNVNWQKHCLSFNEIFFSLKLLLECFGCFSEISKCNEEKCDVEF